MAWQGHLSPKTEGLATQVIGAAIDVHRLLGPGYVEQVYENALVRELSLRSIPWERQKEVIVRYKDEVVGTGRIDLLVDSTIVVELKAVEHLLPLHAAQLNSYLKSTGCSLGLLMNFNVVKLKHGLQRILLKKQNK